MHVHIPQVARERAAGHVRKREGGLAMLIVRASSAKERERERERWPHFNLGAMVGLLHTCEVKRWHGKGREEGREARVG